MTIGGLSGKEFNLPLHDCVLLVSRMARPVIQRLMKSSKIPAKVWLLSIACWIIGFKLAQVFDIS